MGRKSTSKSIIKDIVIVVIGVLIIWISLQFVFGTQNPFYVVSSGSMIPELEVYDVLVVQGNDPFEELVVGDVIVFDRPSDHDRVIVHRVAAITDDDPRTIRTKGDANPASIPGTDFPITEEEYIGKVAYVIPQVGYVTRILTPPINYIIIAVIVGIMIIKQISKNKKEKELGKESLSATNSEEIENDFENDEKSYSLPENDKEYLDSDKENTTIKQNDVNVDDMKNDDKKPSKLD